MNLMLYSLRTFAALCFFCAASFLAAHAQPLPVPSNGGTNAIDANKPAQTPLPVPSASARDLFSRYKDRLVQVRVLLNSANEQSSLGSGFVVRDDGPKGVWIVTNYHVISSLAIDPEKFRLELRPTSERSVKATLIAIDVIHDLAVLRTEPAEVPAEVLAKWPTLALRDTSLNQGERVFSLGNPLELGFLISEGIYNGPVESRIYEQMLFSGALNSGMSGGPSIDDAGRVVGVNVATSRNGQLLAFLVPVRYARELLELAWKAPVRKEWRGEVARQLLMHQNFVASKILQTSGTETPKHATDNTVAVPAATAKAGFASQTLAGRVVPTLDGSLTKCWAGGRDGERLRYQRDTLNCSLRSELFVRGNLYTGYLSLSHVLLRNDKLATPQFLAIGSMANKVMSFLNAGSREMTANECRDDYVRGTVHVYRVAVCLKAYRKFADIYDFSVSATQVDDPRERLTSSLSLNGVSFDNGQKLSRMFLERMQ